MTDSLVSGTTDDFVLPAIVFVASVSVLDTIDDDFVPDVVFNASSLVVF